LQSTQSRFRLPCGQLAMRAAVAVHAVALRLVMRAAVAVHAVVFQLAMRAPFSNTRFHRAQRPPSNAPLPPA
jgi:hypothetical protein